MDCFFVVQTPLSWSHVDSTWGGRSVSEHSNDDLPVPQVMEEILEKFENIPQERISERTQTVDMLVPQILGTIPQEHISERTQITVPVPFSGGNC